MAKNAIQETAQAVRVILEEARAREETTYASLAISADFKQLSERTSPDLLSSLTHLKGVIEFDLTGSGPIDQAALADLLQSALHLTLAGKDLEIRITNLSFEGNPSGVLDQMINQETNTRAVAAAAARIQFKTSSVDQPKVIITANANRFGESNVNRNEIFLNPEYQKYAAAVPLKAHLLGAASLLLEKSLIEGELLRHADGRENVYIWKNSKAAVDASLFLTLLLDQAAKQAVSTAA